MSITPSAGCGQFHRTLLDGREQLLVVKNDSKLTDKQCLEPVRKIARCGQRRVQVDD
jgi:hypothetical protein